MHIKWEPEVRDQNEKLWFKKNNKWNVFSKKKKNVYTEQNYKRNTFVFAPIFHELNSKI